LRLAQRSFLSPGSREAHEVEMKIIREEMKKLQASNGEILTLLKRDCNGE
jgi:hypothetical protein